MEFNEKLQELRIKNNLTQEELASKLYVSRTAISKWESGRGYPNIDSLKALANFFNITVDELLSSNELLTIAQEEKIEKENYFRDLCFGLMDLSVILFLFLPFFALKSGKFLQSVSLLAFNATNHYLKIGYFIIIIGIILIGILTLSLQNYNKKIWIQNKRKISFLLNIIGLILFIISLQPYAASFLFVLLLFKVLMLIKLN